MDIIFPLGFSKVPPAQTFRPCRAAASPRRGGCSADAARPGHALASEDPGRDGIIRSQEMGLCSVYIYIYNNLR